MSQQNVANAHEAQRLSEDARSSAEKGTERMARLSAAIDKIKTSADETANVGMDKETPVSEDYTAKTSKFSGKIDKVTITVQ